MISVVFLASVFFYTGERLIPKGVPFTFVCETQISSYEPAHLLMMDWFCLISPNSAKKNEFQVMTMKFLIIQFLMTKKSCPIFPISTEGNAFQEMRVWSLSNLKEWVQFFTILSLNLTSNKNFPESFKYFRKPFKNINILKYRLERWSWCSQGWNHAEYGFSMSWF